MKNYKGILLILASLIVAGGGVSTYMSYVKTERAEKRAADTKVIQTIETHQPGSAITFLTLREAETIYKTKKAVFIDARSDREYEYSHIVGAISAPYETVKENPQVMALDREKIVVAYCNSERCPMAELLATKLKEMGFKHIFVFPGGIREWMGARNPLQTAEVLQ